MNQKSLSDLAQKSVRLSVITEKHQEKLEAAIERWFLNDVLKGLKLPLLKKVYEAGAYDAFADLLARSGDAERIKALHKVDAFNPRAQMLSSREALTHLERLARSEVKPHPNPNKPAKTATRKKAQTKGVLANSKY